MNVPESLSGIKHIPRWFSSASGIPSDGCKSDVKAVTKQISGGTLKKPSGPHAIYQPNALVSSGLINRPNFRLRINDTMTGLQITRRRNERGDTIVLGKSQCVRLYFRLHDRAAYEQQGAVVIHVLSSGS